MSLDLIMGYTGLLSLGHAAYFGVAGYTAGILMVRYQVESFWINAPCAILVAALTAAVFGIIALRVSGIYFLLVTFALGQLLFSVATKWYSLTGGSEGLPGISRPDIGLPWLTWDAASFYYFVLLLFAACFFVLNRIVNSPFGYSLQGIRDDESRMRVLGYNTWSYKYIAFIVAGLFAGVAGVLFAYYTGLMAPQHLGVVNSTLVMLMLIIGGLGTLFGSLIGSAVIVFMEFYTSIFTPERWPLFLGAVFVAAVMYLRGGIGVHLYNFWKKACYKYGST
jgi:branched-chain amino acid transport system permease protein